MSLRIVVAKVVALYVKMGPSAEVYWLGLSFFYFFIFIFYNFNWLSFKLKGILHYATFLSRAQFYSLRKCCHYQ